MPPINPATLRTQFETLWRTLNRERAMRLQVLKDPEERARRVQEIDDALAIVVEWKDTLKQLANEPIGFAEPQQETLFSNGVHADTRTRRRPTY